MLITHADYRVTSRMRFSATAIYDWTTRERTHLPRAFQRRPSYNNKVRSFASERNISTVWPSSNIFRYTDQTSSQHSFNSWSFTQSQETQKTIVIAAMLEPQTKEIIKILLLRVLQHGRHDVRWNPAIPCILTSNMKQRPKHFVFHPL